MIPLLYEANHSLRVNYHERGSIGRLSDAISCIITEELNGIYELTITYPVDGLYISQLMNPCLIAVVRPYADGNSLKRELAWFDVYKRVIDGNVATISAFHISYRLAGSVCYRVPMNPTTADGAISMIQSNLYPQGGASSDFTITADSVSLDSGSFVSQGVKSFRDYLFDSTYSVVKLFGVEAVYHGLTIHFAAHRGEDRGAEIRYGKNLTGGTISKDETESYNALYAYVPGSNILIDAIIYPTPQITPVRLQAVDFSAFFDTEPTVADVRAVGEQYFTENKPWLPVQSADITFYPDEKNAEAVKEVIDLGDTVTVFYGDADLAGAKMRVVRIRYDVLLEHFSEYTLGQLERGYAVTSRDGLSATRQIMA